MSKSNSLETSLLALLFNATPITNVADNAASSPATQLYISLHTADPGEAGSQTTSEANYTSYARVAVNRNSGAFTVAAGAVTNVAAIVFPTASGGSSACTHFGVGLASSGAGTLLYSGTLGGTVNVSSGGTPQIGAGLLSITED